MPAPDNLQVQTPGQPQASAEQSTTTTSTSTSTEAKTPEYTAKHNGGGRWRVYSTTSDDWFSDFVATGEGAKDAAQAEADRLNAGGQPFVKPEDQVQQAQSTVEAATQASAEQVRPRRNQAVLTDEGWLVPDLPVAYTKE